MYEFRLYVAGRTPHSVSIAEQLGRVMEDAFDGHQNLEVIDVIENPELAWKSKVMATPTLDKVLPKPARRVIGDLSHEETVLPALGLSPNRKGEYG